MLVKNVNLLQKFFEGAQPHELRGTINRVKRVFLEHFIKKVSDLFNLKNFGVVVKLLQSLHFYLREVIDDLSSLAVLSNLLSYFI